MTQVQEIPIQDLDVAYAHLLEHIQAVRVERAHRIAHELIETKYDIGEAVVTSGLYEPYAYGARLVPKLAEDLGMGARTLYYCMEFYRKAIEAGGLDVLLQPVPKNLLNWSYIKSHVIGPVQEADALPPEPKKKEIVFRDCITKTLKYARGRVGDLWRQEDQDELIYLLRTELEGKATGRKPNKNPSNPNRIEGAQED